MVRPGRLLAPRGDGSAPVRRWRQCRAALVLAALALGALLPAAGVRAAQDEIVPGGVLGVRLESSVEQQRQAIGGDGRLHPLKFVLIPQPAQRDQVTGDIQRDVRVNEALLTYGLSDRWNVALALPQREIRQTSTLATGSADPALTGTVAALQSRTVSGLGDVRLTVLHRPVFTDTDGFTLGYGVIFPGSPPESPYVGRGTPDAASPYWSLQGILHYTRYLLSAERARFDLRFHLRVAQDATVRTPDGRKVLLDPPNAGGVSLGWEQEFDTLAYGLAVFHESTTNSQLDNRGQPDLSKETRIAGQISLGNLSDLETGRVRFAFQAGLKADTVVHGFNVVWSTRYTAFFQTYF